MKLDVHHEIGRISQIPSPCLEQFTLCSASLFAIIPACLVLRQAQPVYD